MFDRDRWQEIFEALGKNKVRTALTGFGVGWGMTMLILMMGAGKGIENAVTFGFSAWATNSMFLWSQGTSMPYKGFQKGRRFELENEDAEALRTEIPELDLICPRAQLGGYRGSNNVVRNEKTAAASIYGDIPDYFKLEKRTLLKGRFLNEDDLEQKRKVLVIGQRVVDMLFETGDNPIGEFIRVNGVYFKVVGTYDSKRKGEEAEEDLQTVMMPLSTFQQTFNWGNIVGWFSLSAKPGYSIQELQPQVFEVLKQRHSVHPDDERAFGSWNLEEEFQKMNGLFIGINMLSLVVSIFSLIAGAIGISNIMLVVVKERTKEIGIRRALGATPWNIKGQIILEAVFLTTIAGIIGIVFGVWVMHLVDVNFGENPQFLHPGVGLNLVLAAFGILILVGVFAGLLPASRATQVKPVEALRADG
jgi:putative ABC transport system permease protein